MSGGDELLARKWREGAGRTRGIGMCKDDLQYLACR